jgi:hypothetical protein
MKRPALGLISFHLSRFDFHVEGSHSLIIGKAKHFCKKAQVFFPALQYDFFRFQIFNIKAIGRFKNLYMFFYKEEVFVEAWVHVKFSLAGLPSKQHLESAILNFEWRSVFASWYRDHAP